MTIIDDLVKKLAPVPPDDDDKFTDVSIEVGDGEMILPVAYRRGLSGTDEEIDDIARSLIRRAFFVDYGGLEHRVPGVLEHSTDLAVELFLPIGEMGGPLRAALEAFAVFFEARGISLRVVQLPASAMGAHAGSES